MRRKGATDFATILTLVFAQLRLSLAHFALASMLLATWESENHSGIEAGTS